MKKLSFKADELEMTINFKALRSAFVFNELCLTIYCLYRFYLDGELPEVSVIWLSGLAIFFLMKYLYTYRITRDEGDEE